MNSFFAMLFEWLNYHEVFSTPIYEAYDEKGYTYLGLVIILSSTIVMAIFYYGWNPTYGRWYHWIGMVITSALISGALAFGYLTETLIQYTNNSDYSDTESFILDMAFITIFYTFLFSLVSSFVIRIGSSKNKANPFALRLK